MIYNKPLFQSFVETFHEIHKHKISNLQIIDVSPTIFIYGINIIFQSDNLKMLSNILRLF